MVVYILYVYCYNQIIGYKGVILNSRIVNKRIFLYHCIETEEKMKKGPSADIKIFKQELLVVINVGPYYYVLK